MKLTLIMVTSIDGVIARSADENSFTWNSKEDRIHFREMTKRIGTVVLGSNTFRAAGAKALAERHNVVLTSDSGKFSEIDAETTEFVSGSAKEIYEILKKKDIEHAALIGGGNVNNQFLAAGLVDDIYLTIEPRVFGAGIHLAGAEKLEVALKLESVEKLNERGTLLLHYEVLK